MLHQENFRHYRSKLCLFISLSLYPVGSAQADLIGIFGKVKSCIATVLNHDRKKEYYADFTSFQPASLNELSALVNIAERYRPLQILGRTVRDRAFEGFPVTDAALREIGIPARGRRFYDHKTGEFRYQNPYPNQLALENGDQPLKAIRIHDPTEKLLKDYQTVLEKIQKLELWIVTSPSLFNKTLSLIEAMPESLQKRIKMIMATYEGMNWWAQDASKPTLNGAEAVMPKRMASGRELSKYFLPLFSLQQGSLVNLSKSAFRFEGGDIIVGEKHVFLGPDAVHMAMEDFQISRDEALKALSTEFGKPVFEVGAPSDNGSLLPITFHIDLTMAVVRDRHTGKEVILLESPRMALETMLGIPHNQASSEQGYEKISRIALGLKASDPGYGNGLSFKKIDRVLPRVQYREKQLEFVERRLRAMGYATQRVPGLTMLEIGNLEEQDIFNYTNSILSGHHAIVPEMGVPQLDKETFDIYRSLGYDVIPMASAYDYFCLYGGPRCAAETYREPIQGAGH